jgi:hypothetical protein
MLLKNEKKGTNWIRSRVRQDLQSGASIRQKRFFTNLLEPVVVEMSTPNKQ